MNLLNLNAIIVDESQSLLKLSSLIKNDMKTVKLKLSHYTETKMHILSNTVIPKNTGQNIYSTFYAQP